MSNYSYGTTFTISGEGTTSDVAFDWGIGAAIAGVPANGTIYKVRKVIITNDDNTDDLYYTLDATRSDVTRGHEHILLPGETVTHHTTCETLWISASNNTPNFRAWGEG